MERFIAWSVRRFVAGPARSWVFTSIAVLGYRFVRSATGRKEIVDVGNVGKGQKIIIEQLPVTHREQLKEEKLARRVAKRERRDARKDRRAERRARRRAQRE